MTEVGIGDIDCNTLAQQLRLDPRLLDTEFPSDYMSQLKIAKHIPNWAELAPLLGFSSAEIQHIRSNLNLVAGMHEREVLAKWKSKNAFLATYRQIVSAYLELGNREVAEAILREINIGAKATEPRPVSVSPPTSFESFSAWLRSRGLNSKDIKLLSDEGFGTIQGFALLLPEDIQELSISRAGSRLLPKLIEEVKKSQNAVGLSSTGQVGAATATGSSMVAALSPPTHVTPGYNDIDYSRTDCSNAYNTMVRCSVKLNYAMSKDPQSLVHSLLREGFIAQPTLDETIELNETKSSKGSRLYSAVLGRVRSFPKKFADFIEILRADRNLYGDVLVELDRMYNNA